MAQSAAAAAAGADTGAKPSRVRERLIVSLRELIVSGELKGGQKINELDLAALLKSSRTPLREALLHLERESLVRSDLRRGFSVEPLSARAVRETYPMLSALECHAVKSTLDFIPALIPELARINAAFERARSAERALALDTLWHDTLMSRSNNARLKAFVGNLRRTIERYERIYMADIGLTKISARQHEDILTAFREEKVDVALEALEHNYHFGMRALLKKMGEV